MYRDWASAFERKGDYERHASCPVHDGSVPEKAPEDQLVRPRESGRAEDTYVEEEVLYTPRRSMSFRCRSVTCVVLGCAGTR